MNMTLPGFGAKPAPLPDPIDRAGIAEDAARMRAEELRKRRGRQASILTTPTGLSEGNAGNLQRPTLLGQ